MGLPRNLGLNPSGCNVRTITKQRFFFCGSVLLCDYAQPGHPELFPLAAYLLKHECETHSSVREQAKPSLVWSPIMPTKTPSSLLLYSTAGSASRRYFRFFENRVRELLLSFKLLLRFRLPVRFSEFFILMHGLPKKDHPLSPPLFWRKYTVNAIFNGSPGKLAIVISLSSLQIRSKEPCPISS